MAKRNSEYLHNMPQKIYGIFIFNLVTMAFSLFFVKIYINNS